MGPRFDDDLDYWVDNPDEREGEDDGIAAGSWPSWTWGFEREEFVREARVEEAILDSFGVGYPDGYRHAADCRCSDCNT